MNLPSNSLSFLNLLVLVAVLFSLSSAQPNFWGYNCSGGNYTNGGPFAANLNNFLSNITSGTQLRDGNIFYTLTAGTERGDDFFNGLSDCRADLSSSDCYSCLSDAAGAIRQACPTQKAAIGWYRDCSMRYSDRPISDTSEKFFSSKSGNVSNPEAFYQQLTVLLKSLQAEMPGSGGRMKWASGSSNVNGSESVYALLQCYPDVNESDCSKCVQDLINYIPTCCYETTGSVIFLPDCACRYDNYQFYRLVTKGHSRLLKVCLSIAIPTFIAILLAVGIWIFHRRRKAQQVANEEIHEIIAMESLKFDLTTIKVATQNFSLDNKLGEGGFGKVYKGKLGTGQQIAVKRLSKDSGQGITEFKTELLLVAKLQHKNLVKLLGFCATLKEMILVYEYVPNSSLDHFLFDPRKNVLLDWGTRFKIIRGIARGLLYLHEDSRLKVIHRDLKTSNILLDDAMNPKISDFGLAKLFGVEGSQGRTKRIVGTYGYMAPEYAITGHYSVKSDVFSFGVMVLEIVSGQKNRYFARPQAKEALLHRAWRLWNENNILDLVDPALDNKHSMEQIIKCIHIGLLSIQEDPVERPRMASIVATLNGESISLPKPRAPQFFGDTRRITMTCSTNSNPHALGNEVKDIETSNSFSGTENITNLHPR